MSSGIFLDGCVLFLFVVVVVVFSFFVVFRLSDGLMLLILREVQVYLCDALQRWIGNFYVFPWR